MSAFSFFRASPSPRLSWRLLLFHGFILVLPVLWLIYEPRAELFVYWLSVFLVLQFVWLFWSWHRVAGSLFDPYSIFLFASVLFNGGKAILEAFHLNEAGIENFLSNEGYLLFSFSPDTIVRSLLLVSLGLGSFHLGALLAAWKRGKVSSVIGTTAGRHGYDKVSSIVGLILISISFVPLLVTLGERYQTVLSSGYMGLFQRQTETGLGSAPQVLANFMVPGVFFLLAGASKRRWPVILATATITTYALIQAFTGTRMWWTMPLVAYVWMWHRCIAPIPRSFLVVGAAIVLFVVFPTMAVVRNISGEERLSVSTYVAGYLSLQNPILSILNEMGGTLQTVAHTIELIPMVRDFDWGMGYAYSLLTVFPNLFWDIHPTVAHGLYAHWLTAMISLATLYEGGGYGFSFIAEAYANFGWTGTPLVLALVGFLFARFVLWGNRPDKPTRMAVVASFLAFFLIYARGESASIVRPLVWYAFVPYLMVRLFRAKWRIMP